MPPLNGLPRLRIRLPSGCHRNQRSASSSQLHPALEPHVIERRHHGAVGIGEHPARAVEHRDGPVAARAVASSPDGSGGPRPAPRPAQADADDQEDRAEPPGHAGSGRGHQPASTAPNPPKTRASTPSTNDDGRPAAGAAVDHDHHARPVFGDHQATDLGDDVRFCGRRHAGSLSRRRRAWQHRRTCGYWCSG